MTIALSMSLRRNPGARPRHALPFTMRSSILLTSIVTGWVVRCRISWKLETGPGELGRLGQRWPSASVVPAAPIVTSNSGALSCWYGKRRVKEEEEEAAATSGPKGSGSS